MNLENHYVSIKKSHVSLGTLYSEFVCRRCLNSSSSQKTLIKHKQKCEHQEITAIETSNEPYLNWKEHFHKIPLHFLIYADFEADEEIDKSSIGKKTTNTFKQNRVCNGYYVVFELNGVLQVRYYESTLGYSSVDWFVDEMIKKEKKMTFFFKITRKDIILTPEDSKYTEVTICSIFAIL